MVTIKVAGSIFADPFVSTVAKRGEMIQVTAVVTSTQYLHQSLDTTSVQVPGMLDTGLDLVNVSACNNDVVARDLTIEWTSGGAANSITITLQPKAGLQVVVDREQIGRDKSIWVYASVANVINCILQRTPYLIRAA